LSVRVEFGFAPSGEPVEYNDITQDVISVSVTRGKDPEQDNFNAGACSVQLNNQTRNYDPDYGPSPYQGLIVPTGSLRIYSNDQIVFTGLITDWNFSYSPDGDSVAEIVAADSFWNLSNQVFTDYEPSEQLSSARVLSVLLRPEVGGTAVWPASMRQISPGVATLGAYEVSEGTNVLSYLQEVERAEPGRLFIDKEGRLVFRSRNNDVERESYEYTRINLSANPSFENNVRSWEATGGTIARTTAQSYIGTASGIATPSVGPEGAFGVGVNQYFTSKPFADYTASIYAKAQSGTVVVSFSGLTSTDGSAYSVASPTNTSVGTAEWTRISTTFTPTTSFSGIQVLALNAFFLDALLIEETPLLDAYFDGSNDPVYNSTDPEAPDYQPQRAFETYDTSWRI
jgi:hypothetical protein